MSLTVSDTVYHADGTVSAGVQVQATPLERPLFVLRSGVWRDTLDPWPAATTSGAGTFSLSLPWPSESDPATVEWTLTLPDATWRGTVPEAIATATLHDLASTYGWTVVAGPRPLPVTVVQGPAGKTGPQGIAGPTGPAGGTGSAGATGPGVPVAGTTGQYLAKIDATDYNTRWRSGPVVNILDYGAAGDGGSDDSTALNNAIAAAGTGGTVFLPATTANVYLINNVIDGSKTNITIRGAHRGVTIKHKPDSTNVNGYTLFSSGTAPAYDGYRFENLTLDGGVTQSWSPSFGPSFNLGYLVRDLSFIDCDVRAGGWALQGCRRMRWEGCNFYGTYPGIMQSGVQVPTTVAQGTRFSPGITLSSSTRDILLRGCRFHFVDSAFIGSMSNTGQAVQTIRVEDCDFRSDWWKAPYVVHRFTPTAYNTSTLVLTTAAGGAWSSYSLSLNQDWFATFRYQVSTGTAFTGVANNEVQFTAITGLTAGDVIETSDGRRAEVMIVNSTSDVWVRGWESVDTFEPTSPPALATAFRVSRYYSTVPRLWNPYTPSDTSVTLWTEPYNPHNGHRITTDDGISVASCSGEVFAQILNPSVYMTGHIDDIKVGGCVMRGGWAEQISVNGGRGAQIVGNTVEKGFDIGIVINSTADALVSGNTVRYQEGQGIWGDTTTAGQPLTNPVIIGNTVHGWNCGPGANGQIAAIGLYGATGGLIAGNNFSNDSGGSASDFGISLAGATTKILISHNKDTGSSVNALAIDANGGAPTLITARDIAGVTYLNGGTVASFAGQAVMAPTTTTAPGAGGAGALPATPAGYHTITINGVSRLVPFY